MLSHRTTGCIFYFIFVGFTLDLEFTKHSPNCCLKYEQFFFSALRRQWECRKITKSLGNFWNCKSVIKTIQRVQSEAEVDEEAAKKQLKMNVNKDAEGESRKQLIGQRKAWGPVHCGAFSAKWTKIKIRQFECWPGKWGRGVSSVSMPIKSIRGMLILGRPNNYWSRRWPHLLPLLSDHVTVIWPSFCRINFSCNICLCIVLPRFLCAKREFGQGQARGSRGRNASTPFGKIKVHCAR